MTSTHLQEHEKEEFNRKIIILSSVAVILIILLLTFGIWAFTNIGIFTAGLGQSQDQPKEEEDFVGNLLIDDLPLATNSAQIIVSGEATGFSSLNVYLNGELNDELALNDSGNFEYEVGPLVLGENTIQLEAYAKQSKYKKSSNVYKVNYRNKPPKLEVLDPPDGAKTTAYDIKFKGVTDVGNLILINDAPVPVNSLGEFQLPVRLKSGDNIIKVVARDDANNETVKEIKVIVSND